jgi:hypothetical protein
MTSRRLAAIVGSIFVTLCAHQAWAADEKRSPLTFYLGGGVTIKFYGYVKADFIWDDGYDLGRTTSGINSIGLPTGPAAGSFDRQQFDETRIGFDVRGNNDLFARFEGDFYGPNHNLRLRHAYVDWYGVMVGQNWTNFMSVENLADTVDFQGAGALPFARLPQVRYTYDGFENFSLSASIEEDIGNSDDYAYTAAARYGFETGMVRVSGLWRDTVLGGIAVDGWMLNLSTVLHLWQGGTLKASVATGDGAADILGAGLSGTAVTIGGNAVGVDSAAITVSHQVTKKLKIAATGSWLNLEQSFGSDTDKLESLHLSAFYALRPNVTMMAEYFTATRTQGNGASFDADRLQLALKYSF